MAANVKSVLHIEKIRDGGSLAATFLDEAGAKWILFLEIDRVRHQDSIETLGFRKPMLIDSDPAKRLPDTNTRIYSQLSGPASTLSWEDAQVLVEQMIRLAPILNEWAADALRQLQITIDRQGLLTQDVERFSPILRFPSTPKPSDAK